MNKTVPAPKPDDTWDEMIDLCGKLEQRKAATPADIDRLRKLIVSEPDVWPVATDSNNALCRKIIDRLNADAVRSNAGFACLLAEMDILKIQFGYVAAPPLEKLLIEHILVARLRVLDVEHRYNRIVVGQAISFKQGEYWSNALAAAHSRYRMAIEALARVQRLTKKTSTLQINIARDGGKQINIQTAKTPELPLTTPVDSTPLYAAGSR